MDAPDTIEREVLLPVEPEEAWEAITAPAELEAWFADEVEELDLRPGGRAAFRWEDGAREAVVEEVDPGRVWPSAGITVRPCPRRRARERAWSWCSCPCPTARG